jgi:hypothetical protein
VTSRIRYLQGQDRDERRVVGASQEVADVAADSVVNRDEPETEGAGDVGAEEEEDEQAAPVYKLVVQVYARQNRNRDEGAVWNLHECRDEGAEAESLYDNRTEV